MYGTSHIIYQEVFLLGSQYLSVNCPPPELATRHNTSEGRSRGGVGRSTVTSLKLIRFPALRSRYRVNRT